MVSLRFFLLIHIFLALPAKPSRTYAHKNRHPSGCHMYKWEFWGDEAGQWIFLGKEKILTECACSYHFSLLLLLSMWSAVIWNEPMIKCSEVCFVCFRVYSKAGSFPRQLLCTAACKRCACILRENVPKDDPPAGAWFGASMGDVKDSHHDAINNWNQKLFFPCFPPGLVLALDLLSW